MASKKATDCFPKDDNILRLLQKAQSYAEKSADPRDHLFYEHISMIAQYPVGSEHYQTASNILFDCLLTLPYDLAQNLCGTVYESGQEEYQVLLCQVLKEVMGSIWTEFNPTGTSFTDSFIRWVNRKICIKYEVITFHKSTGESADAYHVANLGEALTLSNINQMIEFDQQQAKN